jgi:hypothetical protein
VLSSRVRCPNNGTMGPRGLIGAQNSGKVGGRTFYLGNVRLGLEIGKCLTEGLMPFVITMFFFSLQNMQMMYLSRQE